MTNQEALLLSTVLVVFAAVMRRLAGTWLHPAAFFPLFWCFAGIAPLIFAPRDPVGVNAIALLIIASLAVAAGAVAGNGGLRTTRIASACVTTPTERQLLSAVLLLAIPLGLGSSIGFVVGNAVPISDLFDIEKLIVVSNKAYFDRFIETGPPAPPLASSALLPFVYLAPAIGGMLFELRQEKRWKVIGLVSLLPAVLVTVIQTTKGATLFAICLWLASYFAARLRCGKLAVFTKGHVAVAALFGVLLTGFFFAVQLARLAVLDSSLFAAVTAKLIGAAFGHMTALSRWLADYWEQPFAPALGKFTFAGPLEMLGYGQRVPGIYDALIDLGSGDNTNIYTAFRPLVEDFTIGGALAMLMLLGFVGGVGFRLVATGKWNAAPLLIIVYATTMWTPVTWLWLYNSLTVTVLTVALILLGIRVVRGVRPTAASLPGST